MGGQLVIFLIYFFNIVPSVFSSFPIIWTRRLFLESDQLIPLLHFCGSPVREVKSKPVIQNLSWAGLCLPITQELSASSLPISLQPSNFFLPLCFYASSLPGNNLLLCLNKEVLLGNSLAAHWLGFPALTAKDLGSVLDQGTKIPQTACHGNKSVNSFSMPCSSALFFVKPSLSHSHLCTMATLIPLPSWLLPLVQASRHLFSSLRTEQHFFYLQQCLPQSLNSWLGHLQNILLKLLPYSLFLWQIPDTFWVYKTTCAGPKVESLEIAPKCCEGWWISFS